MLLQPRPALALNLPSASVSNFQVGDRGNSFLRRSPGGHLALPRDIIGPSAARDSNSRGRGARRGLLGSNQMHIYLPVSTRQAPERHLEGPSQGSSGRLWLHQSCLGQTLAHLNSKESLGPGSRRNLLDEMAGVTGVVWARTVSTELCGWWLPEGMTG